MFEFLRQNSHVDLLMSIFKLASLTLSSIESFADCKNDNLCGKKELSYEGGINLVTLVYDTKQRLMMALLWVYKIAKKSFDSFVRFITILPAGCGKVSLKFHPYSPTSEPLSSACSTLRTLQHAGLCSSHDAVNSGLCRSRLLQPRDFWTRQSCTSAPVSRSPPDTFKDSSPCNLHAEQKEAEYKQRNIKSNSVVPKKKTSFTFAPILKNSMVKNLSKMSHSICKTNTNIFSQIYTKFWIMRHH